MAGYVNPRVEHSSGSACVQFWHDLDVLICVISLVLLESHSWNKANTAPFSLSNAFVLEIFSWFNFAEVSLNNFLWCFQAKVLLELIWFTKMIRNMADNSVEMIASTNVWLRNLTFLELWIKSLNYTNAWKRILLQPLEKLCIWVMQAPENAIVLKDRMIRKRFKIKIDICIIIHIINDVLLLFFGILENHVVEHSWLNGFDVMLVRSQDFFDNFGIFLFGAIK